MDSSKVCAATVASEGLPGFNISLVLICIVYHMLEAPTCYYVAPLPIGRAIRTN